MEDMILVLKTCAFSRMVPLALPAVKLWWSCTSLFLIVSSPILVTRISCHDPAFLDPWPSFCEVFWGLTTPQILNVIPRKSLPCAKRAVLSFLDADSDGKLVFKLFGCLKRVVEYLFFVNCGETLSKVLWTPTEMALNVLGIHRTTSFLARLGNHRVIIQYYLSKYTTLTENILDRHQWCHLSDFEPAFHHKLNKFSMQEEF